MHENMTFVIGKFNFVSYHRPKKPFGLQNVARYIHNICKGHLGSVGGNRVVKAKY